MAQFWQQQHQITKPVSSSTAIFVVIWPYDPTKYTVYTYDPKDAYGQSLGLLRNDVINERIYILGRHFDANCIIW